MRELNVNEIEQVNGGLSMEDGGVASLGFAVTAATVGAPFALGFGLAVGIGLLFGAYTGSGSGSGSGGSGGSSGSSGSSGSGYCGTSGGTSKNFHNAYSLR